MPFGPKGELVVTWVGPVPEQAEVTSIGNQVFEAVNRVAGTEIPRDLPPKYLKNLKRVGLFNASMFFDTKSLTAWEKRHGIDEMGKDPLAIFGDYLNKGNVLFGTLVRHPPVPDPQRFAACSVILQRGVIVFANGREDLYLRSYFHSAKDGQNFVNFAPAGGLRISFKSDKIWFPLELTRVIQEPYSFVVLDLLTEKPPNLKQLSSSFRSEGKGAGKRVKLDGKTYSAVRITARLPAKERSPDLSLQP